MGQEFWQPGASTAQWSVALLGSLAAAGIDLRCRRIPNALTGTLLIAALVWAAWTSGWAGVGAALLACVVIALPFVMLFLLGGGAGDAKLMGAVGAWLGLHDGLWVLLAVILCGGVMGLALAILKRRTRLVLAHVTTMAGGILTTALTRGRLRDAAAMMPGEEQMLAMRYAPVIFTGVCLAGGGIWLWHG
jgi:prepilin peptidase CpaA